jgi:hypothetical protein
LKKHRDYEDEMNEATKAKEVTAYEDSWYRSLKALADMRPTEVHAPEEERAAPVEQEKAAPDEQPAAAHEQPAAADEQHAAAEDVHPWTRDVHRRPEHARSVESDEETAGVPED